jgi:purine nucleosidase
MTKPLFVLDHDGGVDDYLTLLLALTFESHDLLGVVVTPADCYVEPAVSASRKICDLAGRSDVPVARSRVRGLHPFPIEARRDSFSVDILPVLNEHDGVRTPLVGEPGEQWLAGVLAAATQPATVLCTGPLTTIAAALRLDPAAEERIERIVWMGGALRVSGNVDPWKEGGQDGSMEWNVYWDPPAAAEVFATRVPIVMCPLDLTNRVRMTTDFLRTLGHRRRYPFSDLAAQCYALVAHQVYYFWDVLTAAYVEWPELFATAEERVRLIAEGPSQGRTALDPDGRPVTVMSDVDLDGFYGNVLRRWER